MIPVSTAGNIFGRKNFFVSTFLDKYKLTTTYFEINQIENLKSVGLDDLNPSDCSCKIYRIVI